MENQSNQEVDRRKLETSTEKTMPVEDIKTMLDDGYDDKNSEIIEKVEIINRLKKYSGVPGALLPTDVEFVIKNSVLKVFIKKPTKNMQEDCATFEGWILILKTWLSNEIKYAELDFETLGDQEGQYKNSEICHYKRFLYRIDNMRRIYPWFSVNKSKLSIVSEFMELINSGCCQLNHSSKERTSVIESTIMERQIESWFAFEEGKQPICNHWDIDIEKLFNQLPIGVFDGEIAKKNAIFTGGASAIDLWGIGNDGQTLHVIELKCGNNNGIGVISEMLFYTAVIYDSCIKRLLEFGKYRNKNHTKDTKAIKNNGEKFRSLFAHILSEQSHPLFNDEVEKLIREGLSTLDINFDRARYDYSKKVMIDENNGL